MGGDGTSKDILLGPKRPLWSCTKCHRRGNWASRIKCACGAAAPVEVVRAAKQAHQKLVAGNGASATGPKGRWADGAPASLDKSLQLILKRLENLEKPQQQQPSGPPATPPWHEKVDDQKELKDRLAHWQKAVKFSQHAEDRKMAEDMVERLQHQIQENKPLHVQAHSISTRLERAKESVLKLTEHVATTRSEVEKAKAELDKKVLDAETALAEATRQEQALAKEAQETYAKGFCQSTDGKPILSLDESMLTGATEEFRTWFQQQKAGETKHLETLQALLEAQAVAAANGVRPPPPVPESSNDMELDQDDEEIAKLGTAHAGVEAAKAAASAATGEDKSKLEGELATAKRVLAEQIAVMATRRRKQG